MRRRDAEERRRRDTGGWGLLVRLFSTGERGLPARSVILCSSLTSARLSSTNGCSRPFMSRRSREANGWRWRGTGGWGLLARLLNTGRWGLLALFLNMVSARLFSTSGRSRFFDAVWLMRLLLYQ